MIQAALLGGLFLGVLSALPIISLGNCCCCLWIVGGGAIASYLTQQNEPRPLTIGRGATAGLLAGIAGAFVWLIVSSVLDPIIAPMQRAVLDQLAGNASDIPPDVREMLESMRNRETGPAYFAGFALLLFGGSIVSTIGGIIGATYFRKDVPPALGGPVPPPPLP